ncbi:helix-turn-helix domain-containing protein [Salmonella enterica subsp. enterica serovar Newmexico]|nr:helix-turn-helix domain-containing protein [Salmonella enterica]EBP9562470.1 helix-turn-helix domain-containing protein [Salmonella enterica subsp. enterica]EDP9256963.1 helix-turn-helix domain-containing protein [Salmonella enterica subsp. enterica serovar Newmexico]EDX2437801.1 helix-turn-helix domain-containing protein [Salmonella enterica subsp. enterica serovar Koenigstuhl]EGI6214485.1 helix-turn-helix domain-containing protein [Salmonella enterica subsp. enterica serovar Denver]EJU776
MKRKKLHIADNNLMYGNTPINLTRNEYLLVSVLLNSGGEVSCDEVKGAIWPDRKDIITYNNINQLSSRVKSKLIIAGCDAVITKNGEKISILVKEPRKLNKKDIVIYTLILISLPIHYYLSF